MRRREFITLLAGAAIACPLAARAQQADRVRRIGWLSSGSGPSAVTRSFLQAMRDLGYVEGRNLAIEYRWAAGKNEQLADLAADLVRTGVDVIVTGGSPATTAAKQASATIPIVFASAGAPVQKGIVSSLARPGGNVTGLAVITDDIKALEILKEAAPGISRVAFIYDPSTLPGAFGEDWLRRARARARTLKTDLLPVMLRNPEGLDQAFAKLPVKTDALLVGNSAVNAIVRQRICTLAAQRKIPAASTQRAFADAGCFMSYGEDQLDLFRRAAGYVDKIFKGAMPADLPIEQPTRFQLVINLKTATALGLELPPTLLARADEVIE